MEEEVTQIEQEQPTKSNDPRESGAQIINQEPLRYSHSLLRDQATCPARIYFRRLAKEGRIKTDLNLPMIFGSAVHKGIEERLKFERNSYKVADEYINQTLEEGGFSAAFGTKEFADKQLLKSKCLDNFEQKFYPSLREQIVDPEHQVELRLETPFRKGILVGVVDVAMPGIFADWKTGARVPSDFSLMMDPQSGFYFYLAQQTGMELPKEFVYVYLTGKNLGPSRKDPMMRYSFPVYPTEESVDNLLNNYIVPLAKAYEEGVIYKNPSDYNCSGCLYRTACMQTNLPATNDYQRSKEWNEKYARI
jgi:PD-(D/E)XK nuclease superfamily